LHGRRDFHEQAFSSQGFANTSVAVLSRGKKKHSRRKPFPCWWSCVSSDKKHQSALPGHVQKVWVWKHSGRRKLPWLYGWILSQDAKVTMWNDSNAWCIWLPLTGEATWWKFPRVCSYSQSARTNSIPCFTIPLLCLVIIMWDYIQRIQYIFLRRSWHYCHRCSARSPHQEGFLGCSSGPGDFSKRVDFLPMVHGCQPTTKAIN
jgi:hypothetical protein